MSSAGRQPIPFRRLLFDGGFGRVGVVHFPHGVQVPFRAEDIVAQAHGLAVAGGHDLDIGDVGYFASQGIVLHLRLHTGIIARVEVVGAA